MKIEICIPAYNEEKIITQTLEELTEACNQLPKDIDVLITVSDNGSQDKTLELVGSFSDPRVRGFRASRKGKGIAIREVAMQTSADAFMFVDADLSTHPTSIIDLISKLSEESAIIVGSRLKDISTVDRGFIRSTFSRLFRIISNIFLPLPSVQDLQCGAKLFTKEGLEALKMTQEETWFLDVEVLSLAHARGISIEEVPVIWNEFHFEGRVSRLNVVVNGLELFIALIRIRLRILKGQYE